MIYALLTTPLLLASAAVETASVRPEPLYTLDCKRYESRCVGDRCYEMETALRTNSDWRGQIPPERMESLQYVVRADGALSMTERVRVGATISNGKYVIPIKHVTDGASSIQLENKTDEGIVRERVAIDKNTGFYAAYLMHTDATISDVPIGAPYAAYFGWCGGLPLLQLENESTGVIDPSRTTPPPAPPTSPGQPLPPPTAIR